MFGTKSKEKEQQEQAQRQMQEALQKTKELHQGLDAQSRQIQKQQDFLDKLGQRQHAGMQALEEEIAALRRHNKEASSAIHALQTIRVELKTTVADRFQQQLAATLREMEEKLQADTTKIERLANELIALSSHLKEAKISISQFTALAATIKDADFRLHEHAKALDRADQEKLRLMKRIDDLERMIAQFKRGPRR